jgi:hypothetical protein
LRRHAYRLRPPPPVCVWTAAAASRATSTLPATTIAPSSAVGATTFTSATFAEPATAITAARTAASTRAGWRVRTSQLAPPLTLP